MRSETKLLRALEDAARMGAGRFKTLYAIRCRCGYTVVLFASLSKFVGQVKEHLMSGEHKERVAHPSRQKSVFQG